MISVFQQCSARVKAVMFAGLSVSIAAAAVFFLVLPLSEQHYSWRQQNISLTNQWRQRLAAADHYQQLQRDLKSMQQSYRVCLQSLHRSISPGMLSTQIVQLAKSHSLQITALQPGKSQITAGLNQQILSLDISGAETNIIHFLQLLSHQSGLIDIQQLDLVSQEAGIHLQATLAAYDAVP